MEQLKVSYRDAAALVRARDLLTPIESAFSFARTDAARAAAAGMDEAGFDFAPVLHEGRPIGYTAASELRGQPGSVSDHLRSMSVDIVVSGDTPLPQLLPALAENPFLFVLEGRRTVGFVTLSDLNKHTARLHYYFLLAGLEIALANLARLHYHDLADALARLSDPRRLELIRRFEVLQKQGLDVDELASAELSDLIVMIGATRPLREVFGATSRRGWDQRFTWIVGFRNQVMHPARPLIRRASDVPRLIDRGEVLRDLFGTAITYLRERAPTAYTRP